LLHKALDTISALYQRYPIGKLDSIRHVVVALYETFKDRFVTEITREQVQQEANIY